MKSKNTETRWPPRKVIIAYAIDWAILLAGVAAISYSIWWMVNH